MPGSRLAADAWPRILRHSSIEGATPIPSLRAVRAVASSPGGTIRSVVPANPTTRPRSSAQDRRRGASSRSACVAAPRDPRNDEDARQSNPCCHEPSLRLSLNGFTRSRRPLSDEDDFPALLQHLLREAPHSRGFGGLRQRRPEILRRTYLFPDGRRRRADSLRSRGRCAGISGLFAPRPQPASLSRTPGVDPKQLATSIVTVCRREVGQHAVHVEPDPQVIVAIPWCPRESTGLIQQRRRRRLRPDRSSDLARQGASEIAGALLERYSAHESEERRVARHLQAELDRLLQCDRRPAMSLRPPAAQPASRPRSASAIARAHIPHQHTEHTNAGTITRSPPSAASCR